MKLGTLLIYISTILLFLYLLSALLVYLFQDNLIFQKKELARNFDYKFNQDFDEFMIECEKDIYINGLLFKTKEKSKKGIVIYFHGNKGNLDRWGNYAPDFTNLGYDILMIDYRGYGKSDGTPGEVNLYKDARKIWDWARDRFQYDKWIIYGRSLGSAVASHLSIEAEPDLLILETPFDEINGAGGMIFLPFKIKYQLSNKEHLAKVKSKKHIIYGGWDFVVPNSSTLKLKKFIREGESFVKIEKAGHNQLRDFEDYHRHLDIILP